MVGSFSGQGNIHINNLTQDVDTFIVGNTHAANSSTPLFHADAGDEAIGIGTNGVPSAKLSVGGSINVDGNITASGNISASGDLFASDATFEDGSVTINIGGSSGDGKIIFKDAGTAKFSMGRDNTDNHFKISEGSSLGSNDVFEIADGGHISLLGNVTASGNISSSGFISASSFSGDGSGLTNVPATVTPAGSDKQVQFNDGGSLGGDAGLIFNKSTDALTIGGNLAFTSTQNHLIAIEQPSGNTDGKHLGISASNANRESAGNQDGGDVRISGGTKFGSGNDGNVILAQKLGNVGIGTTSPSEKLHINGGNVRVESTQGYYGSFIQAISSTGLKLGNDDFSGFMFFKDDGNIGIGTESPTVELQVEGVISASGGVSSSNVTLTEDLNVDGTTTLGETVLVGNAIRHTGDTDTKLNFTSDQLVFTIGNNQVMTLKPNAVQLTAPVTASGDISASGDITSDKFIANNSVMLSYQTTTNPIIQRSLIGGVETFSFGDNTTPNATQIDGTNIKLHAPVTASGDISSSGTIIGNVLELGDGSQGSPSLTFTLSGQEDSGIFRQANNRLGISAGGDGVVTVVSGSGGSEGIGMTIGRDLAQVPPNDGLAVQGNISSSGNVIGNLYQPTFHNINNGDDGEENYIPFPTSTTEATSTSYLREWVAPFDGALSKIRCKSETLPRDTTFRLYVNAVIAGGATATSDTVNMGISNAHTFTFDESVAVFSAGDIIRVTIEQQFGGDGTNITMIWNYNTDTL